MVNKVVFSNFRGLNDLTISTAPATMLTGSNGAGKTTILEG
jgi:recombinational DNA repair ATPase RecF